MASAKTLPSSGGVGGTCPSSASTRRSQLGSIAPTVCKQLLTAGLIGTGLCAMLPAAGNGRFPDGGVVPRAYILIAAAANDAMHLHGSMLRTRMVLNHRIYYQLLKQDLLISFEPLLPSQAWRACVSCVLLAVSLKP